MAIWSGIHTGSPDVNFSADFSSSRSGGTINATLTIYGNVESDGWLGTGNPLTVYASFGGSGWASAVLKASSASWNYGGGNSVSINFSASVGAATSANLKFYIAGGFGLGSDSAPAFNSDVGIPAPTGPSAPSASLSAGTIVHTNQTILYASGGSWGDGGSGYYAYQYHNGSDWTNFATGGGTSAGFTPSNYGYSYGATIALRVVIVNGFGQPAGSNTVYVTCASRPGIPSSFIVSPTPMRRTQTITLSWGTPGAGSGSITAYEIMVRYRANSTAAWSNWAGTNNTAQQTPSGYTAFTIKPRGQLQYSIRAQNSYGLWSDYVYVTVEIKGGIVTLKVSSAWKPDGQVYVKVNGVWKEADDIFVKVGGVWKQSL